MNILIIVILISLVLLGIILQMIYNRYQRINDAHKVRKVLDYLEKRNGNIDSIKLQKMLGVYENEDTSNSK